MCTLASDVQCTGLGLWPYNLFVLPVKIPVTTHQSSKCVKKNILTDLSDTENLQRVKKKIMK